MSIYVDIVRRDDVGEIGKINGGTVLDSLELAGCVEVADGWLGTGFLLRLWAFALVDCSAEATRPGQLMRTETVGQL